jgi:futalosine hydrolase
MILLLIPTRYEAEMLLGSREANGLSARQPKAIGLEGQEVLAGVCGFGLIAAGVATRHLLSEVNRMAEREVRVVLAGIAGSYREETPVGTALWGGAVRSDGIGVGEGGSFQSAEELGWEQLPGLDSLIPLCVPESAEVPVGEILSVTAASQDHTRAERRVEWYPNACAEEMEGFAVAMACHLTQTRVSILRGISNMAGDRDMASWRVEEALAVVRSELLLLLREERG